MEAGRVRGPDSRANPAVARALLFCRSVQTTMAAPGTRVLRRYANRKIYDPYQSRYVNHAEIAALVRAGSQVKVLEQRTKRDVTVLALARILSQEEDRALPTRQEALFGLLRSEGRDGAGDALAAANEPDRERVLPRAGVRVTTAPAERVVDELLCHGQRGAFVARRLLADHVAAVDRLEGRAKERGESAAEVVASLGAVRGQLERIARRLERLDERLQGAEDA
jgi:hypothetical protein